MSNGQAFAWGFLIGALLLDQLWRWLRRAENRLEKLRDENAVLEKAQELLRDMGVAP